MSRWDGAGNANTRTDTDKPPAILNENHECTPIYTNGFQKTAPEGIQSFKGTADNLPHLFPKKQFVFIRVHSWFSFRRAGRTLLRLIFSHLLNHQCTPIYTNGFHKTAPECIQSFKGTADNLPHLFPKKQIVFIRVHSWFSFRRADGPTAH